MTSQLVTLARFPTPEPAGFLRNLLEAEGVRAYLADEAVVGMLWYLNTATGGVKLQVAAGDVGRATEIIDEHRQTMADLGPDAFAAEAISTAPVDEAPGDKVASIETAEPRDEVVDPKDELASRALRAAAIGFICFPATFYAAWLIGQLIFRNSELSDKASRNLWWGFGITMVTLLSWWVMLGGPFW